MTEKLIHNVGEKLSRSREMCKGMSERAYLFADYMSEIAPNTVSPLELVACLKRAIEDVSQERRWSKVVKNEELRWQLYFNAKKIRNQAVNIPQIIDIIAEESFAKEFRILCKKYFGFKPPKGNTELIDYPEYVKIAVNWWANVICFPKLDTPGSAVSSSLARIIEEAIPVTSYSSEDLLVFQTALADEIMEDIMAWGNSYISVDYRPCEALKVAGDKIGISENFGYPLKTSMTVWKYKVEVIVGNRKKVLWTQ